MGRLFLIQFDDESHPRRHLIVCRICRTQLTIFLEDAPAPVREVNGITGIISFLVENVHVDKLMRKFGHYVVQDVHCNKCCDFLGYQFVEALIQDPVVLPGDFLLNIQKILAQGQGWVTELVPNNPQGVGQEDQAGTDHQEEQA